MTDPMAKFAHFYNNTNNQPQQVKQISSSDPMAKYAHFYKNVKVVKPKPIPTNIQATAFQQSVTSPLSDLTLKPSSKYSVVDKNYGKAVAKEKTTAFLNTPMQQYKAYVANHPVKYLHGGYRPTTDATTTKLWNALTPAEQKQVNEDIAVNSAQNASAGTVLVKNFVNSAAWGLPGVIENKSSSPRLNQAIAEGNAKHNVAATIGDLAGYAIPWGAAEKGIMKVGGKFLAKTVAKDGAKLAAKDVVNNLASRVIVGSGAGALTGGGRAAVEGQDIVKNAMYGAGMGLGGEIVGAGLGKLGKIIFNKITNKIPLTAAEIEHVKNTPELRSLPEAKKILALPEPSIKLGEAKTLPKIEPTKPDFYASENTITKDPNLFKKPLSNQLLLQEGKPKPINVGQDMINKSRKSIGLPDYKNTAGLKENPFQITKGEIKFGSKKSGVVLPVNTSKLSNVIKAEQAKNNLMKSGEYGGKIPSKFDFVNHPTQYTPDKPIYNNGVGQIERPFAITPGELKSRLPPIKPNETKINGGGINLPLKGNVVQNGGKNVSKPNFIQRSKFYSSTVNNVQAINNVSKESGIAANVARNAGGTAEHIIDKGLVNMAGQKVEGKAVMEIFNMPKDQQKAFNDYLFETHNIDRVKQGKELTGKTTQESKQIISDLEKQFPHFKQKSQEINTLLKGVVDEWGVKSGLVESDLRNLVQSMYKNYVPGYRELKDVGAMSTKSRGMGPAKIINKAIGGDNKLMDLQKSIPMLINKTVKAARKNEVYQAILNEARKGTNPYASIIEPVGKVDGVLEQKFANSIHEAIKADGFEAINTLSDKALSADPKQGYMLTVMENGKPVKLSVTEDLFKSLQKLNGASDDDLQAALKLFKKGVTNPFKALITGYNPLFAVRNVARDIPTAYVQGTENNPFKFVRNLGSAAKSMVKKDATYQEYKALGGEGGNYFNVEKGLQPKGKLNKPLKAISAINNFTETLPRFGEYKGTIKREGNSYATKMKALNNAQEVTVNFGRHGDVIKSIDAVVPYLNPAVQGLDKTVRTLRNPKNIAKALGVITVPTAAIYAINQVVDKKGYDALDNRTKDTYFLFPQGNGKFIKLPKTRELGVLFGSLFERIAKQVQGQPEAFKGMGGLKGTVANNFLIQNPLTDNVASPLLSLKYNKDFADRNIVPQYMINDKRSPRLQYDENTTSIAKAIGDKFNISPKQIDYIIKSYGGIVATLAQATMTKGGNVINKTAIRPFTADSIYNNDITNNFYNKLDTLRQKATDKNITGNIPSKMVTDEERMANLYQSMTRPVSSIRDSITKLGSTPQTRQLQSTLLNTLIKINSAKTLTEAQKLKQELEALAQSLK